MELLGKDFKDLHQMGLFTGRYLNMVAWGCMHDNFVTNKSYLVHMA